MRGVPKATLCKVVPCAMALKRQFYYCLRGGDGKEPENVRQAQRHSTDNKGLRPRGPGTTGLKFAGLENRTVPRRHFLPQCSLVICHHLWHTATLE